MAQTLKRRKLVSTFDENATQIHTLEELFQSLEFNKKFYGLCDKCGPSVAFFNSDFEQIKDKNIKISEVERAKQEIDLTVKNLKDSHEEGKRQITVPRFEYPMAKRGGMVEKILKITEMLAESTRKEYTELESAFNKSQSGN